MRLLLRFILPLLFFVTGGFAKEKRILFSGGKLLDTLSMVGGYPVAGNDYFDTLVFQSGKGDSLEVISFMWDDGIAFCDGIRGESGFLYKPWSGIIGRAEKSDSVWESGTRFPAALRPLDSINTWGIRGRNSTDSIENRVAVLIANDSNISSICTLPTYSLLDGYKQIVYFSSPSISAKIQIQKAVDTTVYLFAVPTHRFDHIIVKFLLSDDKNDLLDPPVGVRKPEIFSPRLAPGAWHNFFNLLGRINSPHQPVPPIR